MSKILTTENGALPFFRSQFDPEELATPKIQNDTLTLNYNLAPMVWHNNLESPLNTPGDSRNSPLSGIIHLTSMIVESRPLFAAQVEGLLLNNDTLFAIGSLSLRDDKLHARAEELVAAVNEVLESVGSPYHL